MDDTDKRNQYRLLPLPYHHPPSLHLQQIHKCEIWGINTKCPSKVSTWRKQIHSSSKTEAWDGPANYVEHQWQYSKYTVPQKSGVRGSNNISSIYCFCSHSIGHSHLSTHKFWLTIPHVTVKCMCMSLYTYNTVQFCKRWEAYYCTALSWGIEKLTILLGDRAHNFTGTKCS